MSKQNNFTLYSIKMSSIERSSSSKFNGWRKLLVFRTRALNAKNFLFQPIMKAHPLHRVMYKLKCPFLYVLLAIILLNSIKEDRRCMLMPILPCALESGERVYLLQDHKHTGHHHYFQLQFLDHQLRISRRRFQKNTPHRRQQRNPNHHGFPAQ